MSMNLILEDMQRALDAGASFAALATAVTLPEICGRCEVPDPFAFSGRARTLDIIKGFKDRYLSDWGLALTGDDLYQLRNGISHRGGTAERNPPIRYVFYPPHKWKVQNNARYDNDGQRERLDIDLQTFCSKIADAVRRWEMEHADNATVQKNLENVLQVREGSFGTPVSFPGQRVIA